MLLKEVIEILDAEPIYIADPDVEILNCCGSDMMSDVLAFVEEQGMILTGLINIQAVRTAHMMDMACVCFVRGKRPNEDIIELAKSRGVSLLSTRHRMFTSCGRLYNAGLRGGVEEA